MEKALKKWFLLFAAPTLAAFVVGFIWPFLHGLYLSFCQFTTVEQADFVGISNYQQALTDPTFLDSFWFTAAFVIVATFIINLTAFAIAMALTKELKGTTVFRTIFFMPNLIGGIVLGYIWQTLINAVLIQIGEPLLALNTKAGYWGLIILLSWQQIGYMMIIYISGLQNISPELMEAAAIDGANGWQSLWRVKLPLVMPSITICLFLTITNAFKLFDQNLSLTAGEPAHTTEMLALHIYYTFYARAGAVWKGIGQAKAVVFFMLVVLIGLTQLWATRSKEVQQ